MKKLILLSSLLVSGLATADASVFIYSVSLNGPSEFPVNASPGLGSGSVVYDDVAHTLSLGVAFSGLLGNTSASHIHASAAIVPFSLTGTAGVATTTPSFAGFPLGVTAGTFTNTLNLTVASSFNAAFVTANGGTLASAEAALASYMASGRAYWNIHSTTFGGGEIRGFLTAVPEPSSLAMLGLGAATIAVRSRKSFRK